MGRPCGGFAPWPVITPGRSGLRAVHAQEGGSQTNDGVERNAVMADAGLRYQWQSCETDAAERLPRALVGSLPFFLWKKNRRWAGRDHPPRSRWGPKKMVEALDVWVGAKIVPSRDHRHFIDGSLSLDSFRVR